MIRMNPNDQDWKFRDGEISNKLNMGGWGIRMYVEVGVVDSIKHGIVTRGKAAKMIEHK